MESIQINEPTEAENITLEQQAAMQDEAKQQRETQQTPVQEEAAVADEAVSEETSEPPERPEWLPEKFESAEDMAQAYASLEKDFHAKGSEEAEPSEVEQPSIQEAVGSTVTKASEEFSESGQLSEQTYAALEANGISRDFVEMYIEGVTSVSQQQTSALMSDVGGQENYEAMSEWASTALTDDEQAVFNETVEAGDPRARKRERLPRRWTLAQLRWRLEGCMLALSRTEVPRYRLSKETPKVQVLDPLTQLHRSLRQ